MIQVMDCLFNLFLVTLICLSGVSFTNQQSLQNDIKPSRKANADIIFDRDPGGSGDNSILTDDEDLVESASGSGSGKEPWNLDEIEIPRTTPRKAVTTMRMTTSTTVRPLSECQRQRDQKNQMFSRYVPKCDADGDFQPRQCEGYVGTAPCWCVDHQGKEIPHTRMMPPNAPDCETGVNLPDCLWQRVNALRSKMVGAFLAACNEDGLFEKIQCHGSKCFCVDQTTGHTVRGTEVDRFSTPDCDSEEEMIIKNNVGVLDTKPDLPDTDEDTYFDGESKEEVDSEEDKQPEGTKTVDIDRPFPDDDEDDKEKFDDNNTGDETEDIPKSSDAIGREVRKDKSPILSQPGILAGIIGGGVVLLLVFVLLIMFIVYRMRKKDEGSYPLDEPRKPLNYSYVRAPEKEIYA